MMDTATLQRLLAASAVALRAVEAEREKLASQLVQYKRRELAEEIVSLTDEKGITDPDESTKQKVAHVLNSGKDLLALREALNHTTADMSFARAADYADPSHTSSADRFATYIRS
jgi:hypothetical protein